MTLSLRPARRLRRFRGETGASLYSSLIPTAAYTQPREILRGVLLGLGLVCPTVVLGPARSLLQFHGNRASPYSSPIPTAASSRPQEILSRVLVNGAACRME